MPDRPRRRQAAARAHLSPRRSASPKARGARHAGRRLRESAHAPKQRIAGNVRHGRARATTAACVRDDRSRRGCGRLRRAPLAPARDERRACGPTVASRLHPPAKRESNAERVRRPEVVHPGSEVAGGKGSADCSLGRGVEAFGLCSSSSPDGTCAAWRRSLPRRRGGRQHSTYRFSARRARARQALTARRRRQPRLDRHDLAMAAPGRTRPPRT
jgi:hypothetical protein